MPCLPIWNVSSSADLYFEMPGSGLPLGLSSAPCRWWLCQLNCLINENTWCYLPVCSGSQCQGSTHSLWPASPLPAAYPHPPAPVFPSCGTRYHKFSPPPWFPMKDSHSLLWSIRPTALGSSLHPLLSSPMFLLIPHQIISTYSFGGLLPSFEFHVATFNVFSAVTSNCRLSSICFILYLSLLRQVIGPERAYAMAACELHISWLDHQDSVKQKE